MKPPDLPGRYVCWGFPAWCSRIILNHLGISVRIEGDDLSYTTVTMSRFVEDLKSGKIVPEKRKETRK